MFKNFKSKSFILIGLLSLTFSFLIPTYSVSAFAANKLDPCETVMGFYVNGQQFTGTTLLINPKDSYQLGIGIAQPDNTTCQPAFFWKVTYQSQVLDSGQIVSNIAFGKKIALGKASPGLYTYILGLAEDSNFTTGTVYKDFKINFTTDPKQASPTGTTTTPNPNFPTTTTGPQEAAGYVARSYDGVDWAGTLKINNPSGQTDIAGLITKLINWLLLIIGMVATIVIIISGIMLVFNGGNESTIKTAKTTILWAIIGLVVSVSAFALVNIIQSLL